MNLKYLGLKLHASLMASLVLLGVVSAAPGEVLHHFRFEEDPGFLVDSVSSAVLTLPNVVVPLDFVAQVPLTQDGPGAKFPNVFADVGLNKYSADFIKPSRGLIGYDTTPVADDFTIELFANLSDVGFSFGAAAVLAGQARTPSSTSTFGWGLFVDRDGRTSGSPQALAMSLSDGTTPHRLYSKILINQNRDYYLAASFDLDGGEATFYVKDLTANSPMIKRTVAHTMTSLNGSSELQIGDAMGRISQFSEGLIDEVRLSRGVLAEHELLINRVPEPAAGSLFLVACCGAVSRWRKLTNGDRLLQG